MPTSAPSFYSLYRRSRYRSLHLEHGSGLDERQQEIRQEQRERFTVAAIGFCLKHSREFRAHFWKQVCRGEGDPESIPGLNTAQIEVEPCAFEDLRIAITTKAGRQVCVIECKTGASLEPKQNPMSGEWATGDSGYGRLVHQKESKDDAARIRYIVLGACDRLKAPPRHAILNVELAVKDWSSLLDSNPPKDELTKDLFESLGMISIPEFASRHTASMKLEKTMEEGAKAMVLLHGLLGESGVHERSSKPEACHQPDGYWSLGFSIYKARSRARAEGARELAASLGAEDPADSNNWLGWVGYESDPKRGFFRMVELGCREARLSQIRARLEAAEFSRVDESAFESGATLVLRDAGQDPRSDREWFRDALKAGGLGSA